MLFPKFGGVLPIEFVNIFERPRSVNISSLAVHAGTTSQGRNSGQLKRGTTRFCSLVQQANAPARVRLHATGLFQSLRLQRFASCFLSAAVPGDASIVQVEAAGDRAHDLDKRSGAIHSPAANTKPTRCCERSARQRIFARLRFPRFASDWVHEKGRDCARVQYRISSVESLYGRKFLRLSRHSFRMSVSVTAVFGANRTA